MAGERGFRGADTARLRVLATKLDEGARRLDEAAGRVRATAGVDGWSVRLAARAAAIQDWCSENARTLRRRADLLDQVVTMRATPGQAGAAGELVALLDSDSEAAFTSLAAIVRDPCLTPEQRRRQVHDELAAASPAIRRALALLHPEVIGPLDGAPVEMRYTANRVLVEAARSAARADRDSAEARGAPGDYVGALGARIAALDALVRPRKLLVGDREFLVDRQILLFSPAGEGRVAEVFGDLANARNVAVFVPGTTSNLDRWEGPSTYASEIHQLALERDARTATIAYLGFEEPQTLLDASHRRYAEQAVELIRAFMDGLRLDPAVRTTLIGHSYGTTAIGMAVRAGVHTDNVVLLASPGIDVGHVSELDAPDTKIYALRNPRDPIQLVQPLKDTANHRLRTIPIVGAYAEWILRHREGGHDVGFGPDPVTMEGVTRLATGRETDEEGMTTTTDEDHSRYFKESLAARNTAAVLTGGPVKTYAEERSLQMSRLKGRQVAEPGLPSPSPQPPPSPR
jgi:hypothetical protein